MQLTEDQQEAFKQIQQFLSLKQGIFVLYGAAGTGKTTLSAEIVTYCTDVLGYNCYEITGIAPTHKACQALKKYGPKMSVIQTVSAFLRKRREHTYVGAKKFSSGTLGEAPARLIILDEVSMVADEDFEKISETVETLKISMIVIGDKYQIPAPSQGLVLIKLDSDSVYVKADSAAFSQKYPHYELTKIVRQAADSPIIKMASLIREDIYEDKVLLEEDIPEGVRISNADFLVKVKECFEAGVSFKVITYTNNRVAYYNRIIRSALFGDDAPPFIKNEILMGYNQNGIIQNGQEYTILNAENPVGATWRVQTRQGMILFPDVERKENASLVKNLLTLARAVNKHRSTSRDYARYKKLKEQYCFLEEIFEYQGKLVKESTMRKHHPLLFASLKSVYEDDILREKIKDKYPGLVEQRGADDKLMGDQETLCSQFCVIEKDISYGYACTAHKAQGSTFDCVFVDFSDFDKIENRIIRGRLEYRIKERNQLKYVACTRAAHELYLLS
jgi:hypothetical protein